MGSIKTKDIAAGFVIIVVIIAGVLVYKSFKEGNSQSVVGPTPNYQKVESKFPSLKVPANADKVSLTSVGGVEGQGEAWRTYENGEFSLTIIADLPQYEKGHFYQGWLTNGTDYVSVGSLGVSKGGYMVNFTSKKDYSSYNRIVVTSETVLDARPETNILEGSY